MIRAHLLRWRPRPHAQRRATTPRVRPSGAASQLDPSHRSSRFTPTRLQVRIYGEPVTPSAATRPPARRSALRPDEGLTATLIGVLGKNSAKKLRQKLPAERWMA